MDASVDGEGVERHDLRFLKQKAVKCLSDEQFLVNNFISQILQAIICVLAEMVNSLFSV